MASIERREQTNGIVWVVRYRDNGRSRSRTFDTEVKAKKWMAKNVQERPRLTFPMTFWSKVDMTYQAPCWIWTGSSDGRYGAMFFPILGRNEKAHRVAWYLAHGSQVPDGMVIDHLCENTLCVNPAHLDVVTQDENMARTTVKVAYERKVKPPILRTYTCQWCQQTFEAGRKRPFCSRRCRVKSEIAPRWEAYKAAE